MATIYKRKNKYTEDVWRMTIRRKGAKSFSLSFDTENEAFAWAQLHEPIFIRNPSIYLDTYTEKRLFERRRREFKR